MKTVSQPSANPTNKLSAAVAASAGMAIAGLILRNLAPQWYDAEVMALTTPLVVFALGYIIKDAPNVAGTAEGDR